MRQTLPKKARICSSTDHTLCHSRMSGYTLLYEGWLTETGGGCFVNNAASIYARHAEGCTAPYVTPPDFRKPLISPKRKKEKIHRSSCPTWGNLESVGKVEIHWIRERENGLDSEKSWFRDGNGEILITVAPPNIQYIPSKLYLWINKGYRFYFFYDKSSV